MKRTSALASAAAITGTMFAAGAAIALNSAILGGAADASPGGGVPSVLATGNGDQLVDSPTTLQPAATQVDSPATVATLPVVRSTGAEPVSVSAGSSVGSEGGEREHDDDHGDHEREHEHEYEGSDDDD